MPGIIQSLLDTDLYKFTMMQAVLHQHPGAIVQYRFKCRTPGIDLARCLDHPRFVEGDVDTGFIAAEEDALIGAPVLLYLVSRSRRGFA